MLQNRHSPLLQSPLPMLNAPVAPPVNSDTNDLGDGNFMVSPGSDSGIGSGCETEEELHTGNAEVIRLWNWFLAKWHHCLQGAVTSTGSPKARDIKHIIKKHKPPSNHGEPVTKRIKQWDLIGDSLPGSKLLYPCAMQGMSEPIHDDADDTKCSNAIIVRILPPLQRR
ncbi:hypothetical protein JB92DRAFT_2839029 [Gautieria morchelliformis]|nr:hypothetical protein JB92DRAFT_2839029 [Gautieria morchelliformis]